MRDGYKGVRLWDGRVRVFRPTRGTLSLRLDLWNHSPTGFDWGYCGSGTAQLALAILANHLGDDERAVRLHQAFKWKIVAEFPRRGWTLTSAQIDAMIAEIEATRPIDAALGKVSDVTAEVQVAREIAAEMGNTQV